MISEIWNNIVEKKEIRQNLSKLREAIKDDNHKTALLYLLSGKEEQVLALLAEDDPKIRKNAALLMGDLGNQEFLPPLYDIYTTEEKLFVKSFYLKAIKNFDYRAYLDDFKSRLQVLTDCPANPDTQKHISEEIRELSSLIVTMDGIHTHEFCGHETSYHVVLLTARNYQTVTANELKTYLPQVSMNIFNAGVMASAEHLNWVNKIRTYRELFFIIDGMKTCPLDVSNAAKTIVTSELLPFLQRGYGEKPPYYFRLEIKSNKNLSEKSTFAKKLASEIERLSGRSLINSTTNYEFEIRLIEHKEGLYNALVKLYSLKDLRFTYRKELIPASIKPVNAALTMALAKDYMVEDAQVLDPFCGVGTMLIERHKAVRANTSYGIDWQADTIAKAKVNTAIAHQLIHYINRDFFDFRHDYLFDEIITDMPFKIGRITASEVKDVYQRFFIAAKNVLTLEGVIILYTHNHEYITEFAPSAGFFILKDYPISEKEDIYVTILKQSY